MQREGTKGFRVGQDQRVSYILKAHSEICVENSSKEDRLLQASRPVAVVAELGQRVWRSRQIEEIPGGDLTTPQ